MNTLEKTELTASVHHIKRFSKTRNISQKTSRNGWQKNEKNKNTGNYKTFCLSRKKSTKTKTKTKNAKLLPRVKRFPFVNFKKLL